MPLQLSPFDEMRLTLINQVHELIDIAEEGAIDVARLKSARYNYNGKTPADGRDITSDGEHAGARIRHRARSSAIAACRPCASRRYELSTCATPLGATATQRPHALSAWRSSRPGRARRPDMTKPPGAPCPRCRTLMPAEFQKMGDVMRWRCLNLNCDATGVVEKLVPIEQPVAWVEWSWVPT